MARPGLVLYMVAAGFEVVAVVVVMPTVAHELNAMSSYSSAIAITVACSIVGIFAGGTVVRPERTPRPHHCVEHSP
ncbi:MAG: hypothetical protein U1U88_000574 [Lawsonella clevelandensis]